MSSENIYSCKFCVRICKNTNSLRNHERLCKQNPNRQLLWMETATKEKLKEVRAKGNREPKNQYIKAKELGLPRPVMSQETRDKIGKNNHVWSDDDKLKQSEKMKQVAKDNPESYSSSNRGRTKQIEKYGIKFQGSWELTFYDWCVENRIDIIRNYIGFKYTWNGERTYYPDFYLPEHNVYVEVKGYKVDRDVAKWSYFQHKLLIISKFEMNMIKNNKFQIDM